MTNEELSSRLKTFALMLKFGHDLFESKTFSDAAVRAVNDSRTFLNFRSSALYSLADGNAELVAQFGQVEPNRHARLAVVQKKFVESLHFANEPLTVKESLPEELAWNDGVYYCMKLVPPANMESPGFELVWLLEYEKEIPPFVPNTAKLLASSISEALYFQKSCKSGVWHVKRHMKRRWIWGVVLLMLCALMFYRVPESATAEFVLKAPEVTASYAWFDGPIAKCFHQDGDTVKKGDLIAAYDTAQLQYRGGHV